MVFQTYEEELLISRSDIISKFTQNYLDNFKNIDKLDMHSGTLFNFNIKERKSSKKINPIIRHATLDDIDEIVHIYKEIYENSYPYKEMEDSDVIKDMISSDKVEWFVFIHPLTGDICGSFTFILDFKQKRGYARGLIIKKKYLGEFDVLKACLGCYLSNYNKYQGIIFRWFSENRTAHAKVQYVTRHCGFHPIAFYPNKDHFYGKNESDVMAICYDEDALISMRSPKIPCIIPEALKTFVYSNRRYDLGEINLYHSLPSLDLNQVLALIPNLKIKVSMDKFNYENYRLSIEGTDSYLSFLHTPMVHNIEKTKYKINNLDELFVLAWEFIRFSLKLRVRYLEVFISAYLPEHQKLFYELGLRPRGYVPSWNYNNNQDWFEDCLVFNHFCGEIDPGIQLMDEERELYYCASLE